MKNPCGISEQDLSDTPNAESMLLVQVSDTHFGGGEFQPEIFEAAVREINDLEPDVVVVTGDLTDNGILSQYRQARARLRAFSCKSKIFCSGNHDYRSTGYLLFKRFFPGRPIVNVDQSVIAVVSTARPERNDGEAGHRQMLWLRRALSKFRKRFKIVMMHHHLVPVPDTGPNTIPILDAGDVLRSLIRSRIDLVLCGHRHRPWLWNLEGLSIVHAGSLSSERLRGFYSNSYNIIEVDGQDFKAELKIVGGEKINLDRVVKGAALHLQKPRLG